MKDLFEYIKSSLVYLKLSYSDEFKQSRAGRLFFKIDKFIFFIVSIILIAFLLKTKNLVDFLVISIVISVIFGLFRYGYYSLINEYLNVKQQLIDFNKAIEDVNNINDFTNNYYEIKDLIAGHKTLANIWHEFCETLIPEKENNEIVRYRNTVQTELYINKENIINNQMYIDKYEALPGILTGLGLIGTFLAITIALGGFSVEHLDKSINSMLGGLSIKFLSSLGGIFTSIFFIVVREHLLGNLNKSLIDIQVKLNKIFPRRTTEAFLNEILIEIKNQTSNMQTFLLNLDFQTAIKKAMSMGFEDLKPTFAEIREGIDISCEIMKETKNELFNKLDVINSTFNNMNESFASSIANAISNSMSGMNSDFGNAINELKYAMNEFKNLKQESSASLIENMINELKGCISNMGNSFQNALIGGSGETVQRLQNSIVEASNYLTNSQDMYQQFMNTLQEQMTKNSIERDESVNRVIGQTIERVSNINNIVQDTMNMQSDKMNQWIAQVNSYLAEIHSNEMNVKNNYSDLIFNLNQAIERQKEVVNSNTQLISTLVNASGELNNSTQNMVVAQNVVSGSIQKGVESNDLLVRRISEFNEITKNVNSTLESNILLIDNQGQIYDNINQNSYKLIDTLTQSINEFTQKAQSFQNQMFEDFGKNLASQLAGLHAIVQEEKEILEELCDLMETRN